MDDRGYTFFVMDSAGARADFEIEFCRDEAAAADHARRMLAGRPTYPAIEVFDGRRSFSVERGTARRINRSPRDERCEAAPPYTSVRW